MALLKRILVVRQLPLLLALLAFSGLAGCFLVATLVQSGKAFAFDHRLHVEGEGLDCTDCHSRWEETEDPGLPLSAQCALCHADIDAEKPPERQVAALFDGQGFRATHAGALPDEVLFSHRAHATRGLECAVCHAGVAADDGRLAEREAELAPSMESCLACHAVSGGPREADCAACHATIRAETPPPSHAAHWLRYHGTLVRAHPDEQAAHCSLCHERSSCASCHQVETPASHDNFWRRRGHGLEASLDRASCVTCHDSDSCQRCHAETRPLNHAGAFGEPRNRHCLSCHEPLRGESCGVCHRSASSHELATPLPADHLPGMDCRQCHGNGQPLPHVDNGQLCTACHR